MAASRNVEGPLKRVIGPPLKGRGVDVNGRFRADPFENYLSLSLPLSLSLGIQRIYIHTYIEKWLLLCLVGVLSGECPYDKSPTIQGPYCLEVQGA